MKEYQLSATKVARLIGIGYPRLDHWIRTGLVECSVPASGKGSERQFSFLDVVRARALWELRSKGVSMQHIRQALRELSERWTIDDPLIHSGRLVVGGGGRMFWVGDDRELIDVLTGQLAIAAVVLPVGELVKDTEEKIRALAA